MSNELDFYIFISFWSSHHSERASLSFYRFGNWGAQRQKHLPKSLNVSKNVQTQIWPQTESPACCYCWICTRWMNYSKFSSHLQKKRNFRKRRWLIKERIPKSSIPSFLSALIHVSLPRILSVHIHQVPATCWEHIVKKKCEACSLVTVQTGITSREDNLTIFFPFQMCITLWPAILF